MIQRLPIELLQFNEGQIPGLPANPRQWTRDDVEKLARSLEETPELFEARPIIVIPYKGYYIVLGGNMRLAASRENNYTDVPCYVLPETTPLEKLKEIVIKDNSSFGAWDYDELGNNWDDLPLTDWGVPAWDTTGEDVDSFGDTFKLEDGEKKPFQQMTFTVADEQAATIKAALEMAKGMNGVTFGNTNSNGNALYNIITQWVDARK